MTIVDCADEYDALSELSREGSNAPTVDYALNVRGWPLTTLLLWHVLRKRPWTSSNRGRRLQTLIVSIASLFPTEASLN